MGPIKTNYTIPLGKAHAVRVFLDDRDRPDWLFLHLMREYVAAREVGEGDTVWAHYLRLGMVMIKRGDMEGLESVLVELVKMSEK